MSDRLNSARSTPLQDRRRRIHLLVVDDSISVQRAVKDAFRGLQDYIVSACGDVASAERLLASNPADLLLCDVVLPGPSGYDLCSRIKEERTDLPVLLLTSAFEPFDEERARHVLADGIIAKPFTALKLRQTVEEALQKSGAAARRRAPQGTPASIQPSPADQASGIGAPGATAPPERSGNDLPEIQTADIVGGAQPSSPDPTRDTATSLDQLASRLLEPLASRLLEPVVQRLASRLDRDRLPAPIQRTVSQVAERLIRRRLEELESGQPAVPSRESGDPPDE